MDWSFGGARAGLVVRSKEVEHLALQGSKIISRVRVPLEGTEPNQLTQAIRQVVAASAVKTRKFSVSIPTQDVLVRFFTMPVLPKAEWDTAVQFEARKYIPFKMETLVWDYRAMPSSSPNRLDVVFVAFPHELFRTIHDSLTAAGIQPTVFEPRSLSLARLIEQGKGKATNEFVCLVDIEEESAHLAIVKDRLPYLTRDISFLRTAERPTVDYGSGTPSPVEAVHAQATTLPDEPTGTGVVPQEPHGSIDPRAQRLLNELSVSIDFFMREHASTTIARVILFGDETLIGSWARWLSDQLHCPVELGTPCLAQRVPGGVPLSFASAVGLLQAGKLAAGQPLNFVKHAVAKTSSAQRLPAISSEELLAVVKTPRAAVSGLLAVGVLAVWWLIGSLMVQGEQRRFHQLTRTATQTAWGLDHMNHEELEAVRQKANGQLTLLRQVVDHRLRMAAKMDALARSLPDGVWLTGLSFDNQLTMAGTLEMRLGVNGACFLGETGPELNAIQQLEEQIKRNPIFVSGFGMTRVDQITAQVDSQTQYSYRTFQLNCNPERRL